MDHKQGTDRSQMFMFCLESAIAKDAFVRVVDAFVDAIDLKSFGFSHVDCNEEGRPPYHPSVLLKLYLYTLKRQRGFTFTLMRGKEKVLGEVGLMFIGYNLSRCISVIGAEKLIAALREHCLHSLLIGFGLVLRHFKQLREKCKSSDRFSLQKSFGLYGALLNSYGLSLVGK